MIRTRRSANSINHDLARPPETTQPRTPPIPVPGHVLPIAGSVPLARLPLIAYLMTRPRCPQNAGHESMSEQRIVPFNDRCVDTLAKVESHCPHEGVLVGSKAIPLPGDATDQCAADPLDIDGRPQQLPSGVLR